MAACHTKHPQQDLACVLTTETHPNHMGTYVADGVIHRVRWPNDEYRSATEAKKQSKQTRSFVAERAQQIRDAIPEPERSVRGNPQDRKSRLGKVAGYLMAHRDEWIPGRRFTDPMAADGGAEGLRRLRELRDHGFVIDERPDPDPNTFISQYRLTHVPTEYEES